MDLNFLAKFFACKVYFWKLKMKNFIIRNYLKASFLRINFVNWSCLALKFYNLFKSILIRLSQTVMSTSKFLVNVFLLKEASRFVANRCKAVKINHFCHVFFLHVIQLINRIFFSTRIENTCCSLLCLIFLSCFFPHSVNLLQSTFHIGTGKIINI